MTIDPQEYAASIARALEAQDQSVRLRAALAGGTQPHPSLLEPLVRRCGVEPDFFVRENLTWALTRLPADDVLPLLRRELASANAQARTQALHTLSKVGDVRAWPWITADFFHDADDSLARTAWRAAVALVPDDERTHLADELVEEFGRGDDGVRKSLTLALLGLGEAAALPVRAAVRSPRSEVAEHARATALMQDRPELTFAAAVEEAKRVIAMGGPGR